MGSDSWYHFPTDRVTDEAWERDALNDDDVDVDAAALEADLRVREDDLDAAVGGGGSSAAACAGRLPAFGDAPPWWWSSSTGNDLVAGVVGAAAGVALPLADAGVVADAADAVGEGRSVGLGAAAAAAAAAGAGAAAATASSSSALVDASWTDLGLDAFQAGAARERALELARAQRALARELDARGVDAAAAHATPSSSARRR